MTDSKRGKTVAMEVDKDCAEDCLSVRQESSGRLAFVGGSIAASFRSFF